MTGRAWTVSDDRKLKKLWTGTVSIAEVAKRLGRTISAIKTRARRLGVQRPGRVRLDARVDPLLREYYRSRGAKWCAEQLGVQVKQVQRKAARIGVARSVPRIDYLKLDRFIRRYHKLGWSDAEICAEYRRQYGRSGRHLIGDRRRAMGLPSNRNSEHYRRLVGERSRQQAIAAGVANLAEVRVLAYRRYARAHGWPEDLRPRAVQILEALWQRGPMTRPEIAAAVGMPWKGSRHSLTSNDPEGSYLAHLIRRGLVVAIERTCRVTGRGRGHSMNIYAIPPHVERCQCDQFSA